MSFGSLKTVVFVVGAVWSVYFGFSNLKELVFLSADFSSVQNNVLSVPMKFLYPQDLPSNFIDRSERLTGKCALQQFRLTRNGTGVVFLDVERGSKFH